ncbi:MAG: sugar transferase [Candidatus Magnetomorum sp.]|nr:sugar transferase [Candidatus Magnetomorum sp.]
MKHMIIRYTIYIFYMFTDYLVINAMIISAYLLYRLLSIGKEIVYSTPELLIASMVSSGLIVLTLVLGRAYDDESSFLNMKEIERVVKGVTVGFLIVGMILVLGRLLISRYVFVFSYALTIIALTGMKMIFFHMLSTDPWLTKIQKRILIYGADPIGENLYRALVNSPRLRIKPVGFIDDHPERMAKKIYENGFHTQKAIRVVGSFSDIPQLIQSMNISAIYVSAHSFSSKKLKQVITRLHQYPVQVILVPDYQGLVSANVHISRIDDIPVLTNFIRPSKGYIWGKRCMDLCLGGLIAVLFILILPVIGLIIKLDSQGPVFFRQIRSGKDNHRFYMYKFRTMVSTANPYETKPETSDDQRITRVGQWLRKTSLDELPQIINVIIGNMSLVGPRPEMPFIVDSYNDEQMERLKIRPGITGLWQLAGDRNKPIHEHMAYDQYYIQNMSFFLDIAILINTLFYACKGR